MKNLGKSLIKNLMKYKSRLMKYKTSKKYEIKNNKSDGCEIKRFF